MNTQIPKILEDGKRIVRNRFRTERGLYELDILRYGGALYFHKAKDGKTVEFKKLEAK